MALLMSLCRTKIHMTHMVGNFVEQVEGVHTCITGCTELSSSAIVSNKSSNARRFKGRD
jgi:hypothetical protein